MTTFSKGRWFWEEWEKGLGLIRVDDRGDDTARGVALVHEIKTEEGRANTRLMIAGPEMYHALNCVNGLLKDPRIQAILDYVDGRRVDLPHRCGFADN